MCEQNDLLAQLPQLVVGSDEDDAAPLHHDETHLSRGWALRTRTGVCVISLLNYWCRIRGFEPNYPFVFQQELRLKKQIVSSDDAIPHH